MKITLASTPTVNILYTRKFSQCFYFHIFRESFPICENKNTAKFRTHIESIPIPPVWIQSFTTRGLLRAQCTSRKRSHGYATLHEAEKTSRGSVTVQECRRGKWPTTRPSLIRLWRKGPRHYVSLLSFTSPITGSQISPYTW